MQLIAKYCAIFAFNIDKCIFDLLLVGPLRNEFEKVISFYISSIFWQNTCWTWTINLFHFSQELQNCFQTDVADVKKGRRSSPAHSQMKLRKKRQLAFWKRGERSYGQQWHWWENKRRKRKRRKVRTCVGILTCDSIVFPPSTTYRVIFNSPPCLVPKWKEKKQANRGKNRGSFIWRMSWKSSSGWLNLIFSFWYWTGKGGGSKITLYVHTMKCLFWKKLFNIDIVRREMTSSVYLVLFLNWNWVLRGGWDSIDFHDTHFIQWAKYFPCVTNLVSPKCAHSWWVSLNCHDTNTTAQILVYPWENLNQYEGRIPHPRQEKDWCSKCFNKAIRKTFQLCDDKSHKNMAKQWSTLLWRRYHTSSEAGE